jgi:hypothetical protein
MDTSAVVMFLVGALGLWGGLVVVIINYQRVSRRERKG